jgi:hypothetical protein
MVYDPEDAVIELKTGVGPERDSITRLIKKNGILNKIPFT